MEKKSDVVANALVKGLKNFFTKNMALKIISLAFAMLIWGYVMMEKNPERVKIITNIPVSFSGESDLNDRNLAVRGDHGEILKSVSARVSVELTKFTDLDASDIIATASLRTVRKAGTYKLKIDASSKEGTVLNVYPGELVIEVDEIARRVIPIEVEYSGELPKGYWRGEPIRSSDTISISGPVEDVSTVSKAICTIDLENRTESCNESILLKYVDKNGSEVNGALFLNKLPSVVVKMDVLKIVTVPVNARAAVMGADALAANYVLYDVVSTPAAVRLVGPESVLKDVEGIDVEPIDASGKNASMQVERALTPPKGTKMLDDPTAVIYLDIREKRETKSFDGLNIDVRGLGKGLRAKLDRTECGITVTGGAGIIRLLERGDISVCVDVAGLPPGSYELEPTASFKNKTMQTELEWAMSLPKVSVNIN